MAYRKARILGSALYFERRSTLVLNALLPLFVFAHPHQPSATLRSLCALEAQLGILERSNADAGGGRGMDAGDVQLAGGAAGEKVQASFVSAKRLAAAAAGQADGGPNPSPSYTGTSIQAS